MLKEPGSVTASDYVEFWMAMGLEPGCENIEGGMF